MFLEGDDRDAELRGFGYKFVLLPSFIKRTDIIGGDEEWSGYFFVDFVNFVFLWDLLLAGLSSTVSLCKQFEDTVSSGVL